VSDDPETLRQIGLIARGTRPLIVCDVDEVVLEFIAPFQAWLGEQGLLLRTDTFRLHGNIVARDTLVACDNAAVGALIEAYFDCHDDWQRPVDGAADALSRLARDADIVLLTALPHRHRARRQALLARLAIPFPLVTTERAKGPAVLALRGDRDRPVAFIDDIAHNHASVAQCVPGAALIHFMAFAALRAVMPPLPAGVLIAADWRHIRALTAAHFGLPEP
jgi:hypothetical protein